MGDLPVDVGKLAQAAAERHLAACWDAWDDDGGDLAGIRPVLRLPGL